MLITGMVSIIYLYCILLKNKYIRIISNLATLHANDGIIDKQNLIRGSMLRALINYAANADLQSRFLTISLIKSVLHVRKLSFSALHPAVNCTCVRVYGFSE